MRKILSTILIVPLIGTLALINMKAQSLAPMNRNTEDKVETILKQMTLEEKIDLLGGIDGFFIRGVPRLGVPRLKMADGPIGVRNYGPATTMAGGIALTATWNPTLAERVGSEIGRDARAKGVHFLLGPGMNIYRAPMNGRNFEYFGEDPFLASRVAVGYINGVQSQGVSATVKHFMGNNSEFDRHHTDSVIDERTIREIYLPVFEAAVKEARVGAIMDSYNLTNGLHMTQNAYLNRDIVRKEWGFEGLMMSDWTSTYDAVGAANGGLDLEMPFAKFMNRDSLLPAIKEGKVSVATVDEKIRRILQTAIRFGWLDRDQTDLSIPRYNPQGRQAALQAARESMVLLKNEGNVLPLGRAQIKSIAVLGPDAYPAVPVGGGSARVQPFAAVSFLEGISNYPVAVRTFHLRLRGLPTLAEMAQATNLSTAATDGKDGVVAEYFSNPDLQGSPAATRTEARIDYGGSGVTAGPGIPDESSARWTGYYTAQHEGPFDVFLQAPGENVRYRLFIDDKLVLNSWEHSTAVVNYATTSLPPGPHKIVLEHFRHAGRAAPRLRLGIVPRNSIVDPDAKKLAAKADVVVLAVGFDPETETEGSDRTFRLPPGQEQLIQEISAANHNTIVVITSGGAVDMNSWLDRVPAVLQAWYPGQEGGTVLAEILFGDVNPSGRLPATFERRWEDNPTHDSYYPDATNRIAYKEGVFVGYRGYEHTGAKPLFPFGYGLSYTTFRFNNLNVTQAITKSGSLSSWTCLVSFDVINTGRRQGAEVAQVYVADTHSKTPRPAKELKGFVKVNLRAGETRRVTVTLDRRAFSYYDINLNFDILVGSSVEQILLKGKVALK
ncbi:MAG: glycoside hydrolase [Acidobacteria bacterium]|nr:MAG: glycoside hydrolase [Acidobacteriota bacterium]